MRICVCWFLSTLLLQAVTPPSGFNDVLVAENLHEPTAFAFAPDGRIFVSEQTGALRIVKNGALLQTPFLTVTTDDNGERGLLGVALDPNFSTNQFVYVYYTRAFGQTFRNVVSRFTANGDVALPGETMLLQLTPLSAASNHNGGALHFGLDGKLYIAVGENGQQTEAQSMGSLLGKVLRMNTDGSTPADNPFANTASGTNKLIYALGFRNPFTFAVQPGTGRIFVNDVGQNAVEEVNELAIGVNYGWPVCEGPCGNSSFRSPLYSYTHDANPGTCAITGGTFYNPPVTNFPDSYTGKYFFADFCAGWIRLLDVSSGIAQGFATGGSGIVDLRIGPDGSIYYLQRGASPNDGELRRIESATSGSPRITRQPASQTIAVGAGVTFTVEAVGSNLTYQWQRNMSNIPSATGASYNINSVAATDNGAVFRVIVTNPSGTATSENATLTVSGNQPPTVTIISPTENALFSGGDTIAFSGVATDPETGALPLNAYKWRVDYVTGQAVRPFLQEFNNAAGGAFQVPVETPYTRTDVYFQIVFTATDPAGLSTTITRRVNPRVANITLQTSPAGLPISLDGTPVTSPFTFDSVVGLRRLITTSTQESVGSRQNFVSWSDGGAASHNIFVPSSNTTYTANFHSQYYLTTTANPANGGSISPGGWFDMGTQVPVNINVAPGFAFAGFSGALTGVAIAQNVNMTGPKSVTANFATASGVVTEVIAQNVTGSNRRWTVRFTNRGAAPLNNLRLSGLEVRSIGPTRVTAATSMPVSLGTLQAGASTTTDIQFNWPVSDTTTRATLKFEFAADSGYSSAFTLYNTK